MTEEHRVTSHIEATSERDDIECDVIMFGLKGVQVITKLAIQIVSCFLSQGSDYFSDQQRGKQG